MIEFVRWVTAFNSKNNVPETEKPLMHPDIIE
jgi:hypothetical protein